MFELRTGLIVSFLVGIIIFYLLKKRKINGFLSLLLLIPLLLQNVLLLIFTFLTDSVIVTGINIYRPVLEESWFPICEAITISYLAIGIGNIGFIRQKSPKGFLNFDYQLIISNKFLRYFLCISAISWFTQTVFTSILVIPVISSFLIFLSQVMFIGPGLAGFYYNKYPTPAKLFILSWVLSLPTNLSVGNRGFLFLPIGIFVFGLFASASKRLRRKIIITTIIALPVVVLFSAGLEAVRYNIRFAGGDVSVFSIIKLLGEYSQTITFSDLSEVLSFGMGRLIQWCNFVAPAIVPGIQPYRYFDKYWDEISFIFLSFNPLEGDGQARAIDIVDSGMFYGSAKYIGYEIAHGYTVPYPGIAEGWVRFGPVGVFLYYFIFVKMLSLYQSFFRVVYRSPRVLYFSLFMASTLVAFKSYEYQITFLIKVLLQVFILVNIIIIGYLMIYRSNDKSIEGKYK